MKRFTSYRKQLLLAGMCLVGLSANAQYSTTVSQYANTDYSAVTAKFSMTDVATTLGTDTATLAASLNSGAFSNKMFAVYSAASSDYVTTYNGEENVPQFWIGSDGEIQNYAAGGVFYTIFNWDAANDMIGFNLGQFPDSCKAGKTFTPKFKVTYGDKSATFDVTYVVKAPVVIPAAASVYASKQNVVGSAKKSIERISTQSYETTDVKFSSKDIADALGIDVETLKGGFGSMLYTYGVDSLGVRTDSLEHDFNTTASGYWFANTVYPQGNEKQGENSGLLGKYAYDGTKSLIYGDVTVADDSLTIAVGQLPGNLKVDDDITATYFLIYGDKAYTLDVNVKCVAPDADLISDYKPVGNQNISIKVNSTDADYQGHKVTVDTEAISKAVGIAVENLSIKGAADAENFYSGSNTGENQGFWFNEEGYVDNWKSSDATCVTFCNNTESGKYDVFTCGMYTGYQASANAGNKYNDVIYFVNAAEKTYYSVTFQFEVTDTVPINDWTIIAERAAVIKAIPDYKNAYNPLETSEYVLSTEEIASALGTSDWVLYGEYVDSLKEKGLYYAPYTSFPCDPTPGIWFGKNGNGAGWGKDSYIGASYLSESGKFQICEMPSDLFAVGDSWTGYFYFANEEKKEMLRLSLTIQFSDNLISDTIVASDEAQIIFENMGDAEGTIDLSKAATALGVTVEELVGENSTAFCAQTSLGSFTSGSKAEEGLSFNWNGSCATDGYGKYSISVDATGKVTVACGKDEIEDESTFNPTSVIGFRVGHKVYAYYISLPTAAGINNVTVASAKTGKMYNIAGQRIASAQKGIYIMDGKKYIK